MSREQAKKNLISFGIQEPTEEQITNYLNQVNGETKKEKDRADKYKDKADKADELQGRVDELEQQGMTDAEKSAKALEEAQKEIASLKQSNVASEVKAILHGAGLKEDDYRDFLPGLVTDDVEQSKTMAEALVKTLSANAENAVKQSQKDDLDNTPTPDGGTGSKDEEKSEAEKFAEAYGKAAGEASKTAEAITKSYLE